MRTRMLTAFGVLAGVVYFAGPQDGMVLSAEECAQVSGGCTVTSFSDCSRATVTQQDPCSKCRVTLRDCDSSHSNEACTPIYDTSAADCIACGTCFENCGGTERQWDGGSDGMDCDGSFTTFGPCNVDWTDAQNNGCSVACGAE